MLQIAFFGEVASLACESDSLSCNGSSKVLRRSFYIIAQRNFFTQLGEGTASGTYIVNEMLMVYWWHLIFC